MRTDLPLPLLLAHRADTDPDATAVVLDGQPISYGHINDVSARVATFLHGLGVRKGSRVALLSANRPEFIFAWFGVMRLGAIEVPINPAARGGRLAYMLADSAASVLILEEELLEALHGAELPPSLETVIVMGVSDRAASSELPPGVTVHSFTDCLECAPAPAADDTRLTFADVAAIIYTSGTTGPSKGVLCPHGLIRTLGLDTIDMFEMTPEDTLYDGHPLFHAHGQGQVIYSSFAMGVPAILRRKFSASGFVPDLYRYGVTIAFLVGAAGLVLKQPPSDLEGKLTLRRLCCVPVPRGSLDALEQRLRAEVIETYGMTELGVISYTRPDSPRNGTCGNPTRRRQVRVADETDAEVPPGSIGEILVRPLDESSILAGYHGKPDDTVAAWRNLWFHTGDLGYVDDDGNIYFVSRRKDAIRRRGENISAYEVELVLNAMPGIQEAAVLAWPSPVGEDDVWAAVVLAPGANVTPEQIISFCKDRLDAYAIPRYITFESSLPKTPTERVEKYKLRERGLPADAYDNEAPQRRVDAEAGD